MQYPVILNGDHAEFEAQHADTPPHERPDWPLPSFDAQDWAKAFCKHHPEADQGEMLGWFANALMRGYDERAREKPDDIADTALGMPRRDLFAALAMNGILANSGGDQPPSKLVATLAYDYADAMLALPEPPKGET